VPPGCADALAAAVPSMPGTKRGMGGAMRKHAPKRGRSLSVGSAEIGSGRSDGLVLFVTLAPDADVECPMRGFPAPSSPDAVASLIRPGVEPLRLRIELSVPRGSASSSTAGSWLGVRRREPSAGHACVAQNLVLSERVGE
jgi:hypothetical protein